MKKLIVNVVSESERTVKGHGVHTAYVETLTALRKYSDVEVIAGQLGKKVDADVIHLHTIGSAVWGKLLQKGPKKVVSAHVVPDSFVGSIAGARYWRFAAMAYMKWFYNHADLIIAVSDQTRQDLLKLGITKPIEILYNFIDRDEYKKPRIPRDEIRAQLRIPADAFVVVGAGQVQPRKRVDDFIAVAKLLPDVHFVWVGGMPFGLIAADNDRMKKLMYNAPKNVHFTGIVALEDMTSYYHSADLFWLPSEQETFGLVVIEGAASGLPILLRDIPDYEDTFGKDAYYAATNEGFAEAITKLQADKSLYKIWADHASQIAARFDSKTAAKQLVDMYRRVVDDK